MSIVSQIHYAASNPSLGCAGNPRLFSAKLKIQRSAGGSENDAPCTASEITEPAGGRKEIHPEDVKKPDFLSQILLVGSGAILILVTKLVITVAARIHVVAL